MATGILAVYLVLLVVGGLIGFLKAGSKVSIIASAASAILLGSAQAFAPGHHLVEAILVLLILMFAMRLAKTKKFMPAGLMLILTAVMLALRFLVS